MSNAYSAQNVAAYLVYEFNDSKSFINNTMIQQILAEIDAMWKKAFGNCAFREAAQDFSKDQKYINEVFEAYKEHGQQHIQEPAKEWFLRYGEFQLIKRPYAIPNFSIKEKLIIGKVINKFLFKENERIAI